MDLKNMLLKFKELYSNMTLQDFYDNKQMFKEEYLKVRKPPYYKLQLLREWKDFIYSLDLELYKRDRIWEYLNDDIDEEKFEKFVKSTRYGKYWNEH